VGAAALPNLAIAATAAMGGSMTAVGAAATVLYMLSNIMMNLFMKWMFSEAGGKFALPWTMLAFQQVEAFLILQLWIACTEEGWGWSSVRGSDVRALDCLQILAVTCLFCCNVGLNSLSLVWMSITLNQTIRAFLPLGVLIFATCLERRSYPKWSYITAGVLITGIVLSCLHCPEFELYSFSLALGSTLIASLGCSLNGRILHVGSFCGQEGNPIVTVLMLQSLPAAAIFAVVAFVSEGQQLQHLVRNSSSSLCYEWLALLSLSGILALATNLFRCLLVAVTSALTETFAGNVKVAALCVIDNRLFGTVLGTINYVGVIVTFLGFSIHSVLQYVSASPIVPEATQQGDNLECGQDNASLQAKMQPTMLSMGQHQMRYSTNNLRGLALPETGLAAESLALQLKVARKRAVLALHNNCQPSRHSWHAGSSLSTCASSHSRDDMSIETTHSYSPMHSGISTGPDLSFEQANISVGSIPTRELSRARSEPPGYDLVGFLNSDSQLIVLPRLDETS